MRQIKYSVMWKFKLSLIEVADNNGIYNCWARMCKHILDSFTPQYAGHRTRLNYISFILFISLITQYGVWPVTGGIFST